MNPLDPALVSGTTIFGITYTAEQYAIALAQTIVFSNLIICELLFVYTCTSNIKPFYKFPNKHLFWATGLSLGLQFLILYTPMGIAFHVIPLTQWVYWVAVLLGAFSVSVVDELRKYRIRLKLRKDPDYLTKKNI